LFSHRRLAIGQDGGDRNYVETEFSGSFKERAGVQSDEKKGREIYLFPDCSLICRTNSTKISLADETIIQWHGWHSLHAKPTPITLRERKSNLELYSFRCRITFWRMTHALNARICLYRRKDQQRSYRVCTQDSSRSFLAGYRPAQNKRPRNVPRSLSSFLITDDRFERRQIIGLTCSLENRIPR
jgi:hypothetical protein